MNPYVINRVPDRIPNALYKSHATTVSKILTEVFNHAHESIFFCAALAAGRDLKSIWLSNFDFVCVFITTTERQAKAALQKRRQARAVEAAISLLDEDISAMPGAVICEKVAAAAAVAASGLGSGNG